MATKIKRIALLAAVTFVEAFLGVLIAAGISPDAFDTSSLEKALVGGLAALASVVYNAARELRAGLEAEA